jgi:NAD(P)-dependent dehydrogenase (short-subunit alcohol dehydrogenase family)
VEILVTGGANGIGKSAVEKLRKGHSVKVFDRDADALKKLPEDVETFQGDVADEDRVKEVLEQLDLDVLVNCAGYYELGALEDVPSEVVEEIYGTNVFGPLNFIRHSTEMLRNNSGRIINVSSVAGRVTTPFFGIYSSTKFALEALSDAQRMELRETDVEVVIIEPGAVHTGFNARARDKLQKYVPDSFYTEKYRQQLEKDMDGMKPEKAADKIVKAVESDNPRSRYPVGIEAWVGPRLKAVLPTFLMDKILGSY